MPPPQQLFDDATLSVAVIRVCRYGCERTRSCGQQQLGVGRLTDPAERTVRHVPEANSAQQRRVVFNRFLLSRRHSCQQIFRLLRGIMSQHIALWKASREILYPLRELCILLLTQPELV